MPIDDGVARGASVPHDFKAAVDDRAGGRAEHDLVATVDGGAEGAAGGKPGGLAFDHLKAARYNGAGSDAIVPDQINAACVDDAAAGNPTVYELSCRSRIRLN